MGKVAGRKLKIILDWYSRAFGQLVNKDKSYFFFFHVNKMKEREIQNILGYCRGALPCKYLGLPLEKGIKSTNL